MMKETCTSETSEDFYYTTRRNFLKYVIFILAAVRIYDLVNLKISFLWTDKGASSLDVETRIYCQYMILFVIYISFLKW